MVVLCFGKDQGDDLGGGGGGGERRTNRKDVLEPIQTAQFYSSRDSKPTKAVILLAFPGLALDICVPKQSAFQPLSFCILQVVVLFCQ